MCRFSRKQGDSNVYDFKHPANRHYCFCRGEMGRAKIDPQGRVQRADPSIVETIQKDKGTKRVGLERRQAEREVLMNELSYYKKKIEYLERLVRGQSILLRAHRTGQDKIRYKALILISNAEDQLHALERDYKKS